jgi:hypothetical protein
MIGRVGPTKETVMTQHINGKGAGTHPDHNGRPNGGSDKPSKSTVSPNSPHTDYGKLIQKIENSPPKISDETFSRVFGFPEPK